MTERVGEPSQPVVSGTISIGEVLQLLKREFPDVTISKIRFLESEGLVTPERTASGYRRFAQRDIDQLRAVLTLQRDQYLPLKVIRDHIEAGMADPEAAAKLPVAGTGLRPDDFRAGAGRVRMTREELAEASDLTEAFIAQLESIGIVWASAAGHYDEDALAIANVVSRLSAFGLEAQAPALLPGRDRSRDRSRRADGDAVLAAARPRRPGARAGGGPGAGRPAHPAACHSAEGGTHPRRSSLTDGVQTAPVRLP